MGDTGVCGAGVRCNGLIERAAVLLVVNGMIRTAKQLPEVLRAVVWGRAALCLAGASCDWLGGNIEKLIFFVIPRSSAAVGCAVVTFDYSRLPHPQDLRFRVWIFRMHGLQWNNTRIILTDARYPAIDAFCLVRTGGN